MAKVVKLRKIEVATDLQDQLVNQVNLLRSLRKPEKNVFDLKAMKTLKMIKIRSHQQNHRQNVLEHRKENVLEQ